MQQENVVAQELKKREDFEALCDRCLSGESTEPALIEYHLPYPKEDFLRFLTHEKKFLLHGSSNKTIEILKPRQANDAHKEFGNKKAIYAVEDPVFPIFHAIQDRSKLEDTVISERKESLKTEEDQYSFRMPKKVLEQEPWMSGIVYILDRGTFTQGVNDEGHPIDEWASEVSVKPTGKIEVTPEDFRFLDQVESFEK